MYQPQRHLTFDLLSHVLSEYDWPAPYTLEDELPDGIVVRFPKASLLFGESFEGDVELEFLPEDTGTQRPLNLTHALLAVIPEQVRDGGPLTPDLIRDDTPGASEDKVRNGLRDLCRIVLTHLRPCVLGDFGWVTDYLRLAAQAEET